MSQFYEDSVFWIDVEKIHPNPFQPRREFDQMQLQSLSDSIRQYGVLQALVVTRKEVIKEDGGLVTEYELIAGERRLRASKLAGLAQVPALIKIGDETNDLLKLELAIIENVQREDLNPVDRSRAFNRLADEFGFKHAEIAKKVGKSREYVSNTIRIVMLPPEILDALATGKISEGHTRPLMMLTDRPAEQSTIFKEIMLKRLSVREAEAIARRIAYDKVRKKAFLLDLETQEIEEKLTESLGTRVSIEKKEHGGKITIDFFSKEDLNHILELVKTNQKAASPTEMIDRYIATDPTPQAPYIIPTATEVRRGVILDGRRDGEKKTIGEDIRENMPKWSEVDTHAPGTPGAIDADEMKNEDDRSPEEIKESENTEEEIYSIKNFSI